MPHGHIGAICVIVINGQSPRNISEPHREYILMGHSKSLRTYADVQEIFERAYTDRDQGGVRVNYTDIGQAVNLRARLNHFRLLHRESMAEVFPVDDPRHGVSPFDPFVVRLTGNTLIIEPRNTKGYTIETNQPKAAGEPK